MTRTTEQTLNILKEQIENFDPNDWCEGVTVEKLRCNYEAYSEVAQTLSIKEMRLIYLLRGCAVDDRRRFLTAAQTLYNAYRKRDELGGGTK